MVLHGEIGAHEVESLTVFIGKSPRDLSYLLDNQHSVTEGCLLLTTSASFAHVELAELTELLLGPWNWDSLAGPRLIETASVLGYPIAKLGTT